MEPLDSDFDYVVRQPRRKSRMSHLMHPENPATRFNVLLVFPALGILWLLYLAGAAIFQWDVSNIVGPVLTLMILLFIAALGFAFWAMAPSAHKE